MGIFGKLFKPNIERLEAEKDVEGLIKALGHKDWEVQQRAADALGRMGKPAVEPLIQALGHKDEDVGLGAAAALGKIGEPAVKPLIQALKDKDEVIRERATDALGRAGEPAVEPLIRALRHKSWRVRWGAAYALRDIVREDIADRGRAVEPLTEALGDSNVGVVAAVAEALGKMGDARAVEPLIQALEHADPRVQWVVAGALGDIGDARAAWPLIHALKYGYWEVQGAITSALISIGEPVVGPLIQALEHEEEDLKRRTAALVLGNVGDERALEPLSRALNDKDGGVRENARRALKNIKAKKKVENEKSGTPGERSTQPMGS